MSIPENRHALTILEEVPDRTTRTAVRCGGGALSEALRLPACELLQQVIDGTPGAIALLDRDYRYLAVNEPYRRIFAAAHGRHVARGVSFLEVLAHDPAQRDRAAGLWARAFAGDTFCVTEHFGDDRRGRKSYLEITYSPIRDAGGNVVAAMDCCRDVTERLVSEAALLNANLELERRVTERTAALAEREEQLRLTLESSQLGTFSVDAGCTRLLWSPRACALFGHPPQREIELARWLELVDPADRARITWLLDHALAPGAGPFRDEFRCVWPDGAVRWMVVRGETNALPGVPGAFRTLGTFADVTDRKRHEEELRRGELALHESQERFRVAFQTSPDAFAINEVEDGTYVAVNEGFTRMLGWTDAELRGHSSLTRGIWADPADRARMIALLRKDRSVSNFEAPFRAKDGHVLTGLMSARIVTLDGRPHLVSVTRDMTEWKRAKEERDRLEASLHQAAKMEALGQLAGGIAHDFNNLLAVILAGVDELKLRDGTAPGEAEVLDEIGSAATRGADLTGRLLALARRQPIALQVLDLNAVVRDGEKLLRRVLPSTVTVALRLEEGPCPVVADPGQIDQLVLNLAVNARDAMPRGGELRLETSNVEVDRALTARHPWIRPGPFVRLSVRDTGVGMPPEVKERVFEPFFTTKPIGRGTGLGLAIVYGIVKQNDGTVLVESEPGKGTTFQILLPRAVASGPDQGRAAR